MKKLFISGVAAAVIAVSLMTAQTSYACFCIKGIIWEPECDQLFPPKPTPKPPVVTPIPTTPVDTPTPTTPSTPVTPASTAVTPAPAATPAPTAELPRTGGSEIAIIMLLGLGLLTYGGIYAARQAKSAK